MLVQSDNPLQLENLPTSRLKDQVASGTCLFSPKTVEHVGEEKNCIKGRDQQLTTRTSTICVNRTYISEFRHHIAAAMGNSCCAGNGSSEFRFSAMPLKMRT